MPGATPQKILYVHHRSELGGAPSSLAYLIANIDRERFEPHVYCPPGPAADLFADAGATLHLGAVAGFTHIWASTYAGRRWLLLGRELAHLPRHLLAFRRTLRRERFALVHLNDSPMVPAAWVAHRAGVPVVWHLRSALPASGPRRSAFLRSAIRRLARASIAINRDVANSFAAGSYVVHNAVDLSRFAPGDAGAAREGLDLPSDRAVVAYFGFVYPSKGFRDFIEAAALLGMRGLHPLFLIVGGPVRGEEFFASPVGRTLRLLGLAHDSGREANELVAEHRLEDAVRFVPFTRDTPSLYRASDVVVAPSRGPELGRPVLEAAACGRPVVASGSLDGAGVVLPDRTGLLVPRRSPDVLAVALERLLLDAAAREGMGSAARRHAEASFDAVANAEAVTAVYDAVLAA